MCRPADRNLLLGLLALQNDFIDRDALVDGFHRWVGDRSSHSTRSCSSEVPYRRAATCSWPV